MVVIMKYWGYKIVIPPLWDAKTTLKCPFKPRLYPGMVEVAKTYEICCKTYQTCIPGLGNSPS